MKKLITKYAAIMLAVTLLCTGCTGSVESYGESSNISSEESVSEHETVSEDDKEPAESNTEPVGSNTELVESESIAGAPASSESADTPDSAEPARENESVPDTSDTAPEYTPADISTESAAESTAGSAKPVSPSPAPTESKPDDTPTESTRPADSPKPVSSSVPQSTGSDQPVDKSAVSCSWSVGGTWEDSGNQCGTCEMTITNNSNTAIGEWKVTFDVPNGFAISNSWSGNFSVNGTTVSVTNVEYNGNIPVGGSVNFGFNYSSPTIFDPPDTVGFNGTKSSAPSNAQNDNRNNNQNNDQNNNNNQNNAPSADVKTLLERTSKAKQGDDWLHTDGNKILDKNGKQVWLTGVNWFGYNTGTNTFDGLWNSNLRTSVKGIADHGFNLIRVPMSAQLLNQWADGEYPRANYNNAMNTDLNDMNSLQIFDYFLKLAEENGMKVMPDIHCAETDAMGHNVNLWYTDRVTVEDYYHALEWLAERYKDNDTIIAIDIKNEPHGKPYESNKAIWNDSKDKNNWKYTAETAAKKILAKNPNVLIMVEGTEIYSKNKGDYSSTNSEDYYFNWWGGNLRGVKDYPVDLGKYQNKLVYSPHDYGPTVYEQPWFKGGYDFDSLIKDCWQDNWLYIHKNNTAPLLIGEWGGYMREPNLTWMTCMRRLIKENHLNHTFWCFNANSGDTGGLVLDDFTTWDTEKYNFVKEVLWQENGKFVGLDHAIPLGENGITLTAAKGL